MVGTVLGGRARRGLKPGVAARAGGQSEGGAGVARRTREDARDRDAAAAMKRKVSPPAQGRWVDFCLKQYFRKNQIFRSGPIL
jgi:hypothetical protein